MGRILKLGLTVSYPMCKIAEQSKFLKAVKNKLQQVSYNSSKSQNSLLIPRKTKRNSTPGGILM